MLWISSGVYIEMRKMNPVAVCYDNIQFHIWYSYISKEPTTRILRLRDEAVGSRSCHNTGNKIQNYTVPQQKT